MSRSLTWIGSLALLGAAGGVALAQQVPGMGGGQQNQGQQRGTRAAQDGTTERGQEGRGGVMGQAEQGRGPGEQAQVKVGDPAPTFVLYDEYNVPHTLAMHRGQVVVLQWIDPTDEGWKQQFLEDGELKRTYDRYKDEGVAWLGICSFKGEQAGGAPAGGAQEQAGQRIGGQGTTGQQDVIVPMNREQVMRECAQLKQDLELDFPILFDEGGKVAHQFGANQKSYFVIIDQDARLAYSGPIGVAAEGGQVVGFDRLEQLIGDTVRRETTLPAGAPRDQERMREQERERLHEPQERLREQEERYEDEAQEELERIRERGEQELDRRTESIDRDR